MIRDKIAQVVSTAIHDHIFSGCVVGVVTRNGTQEVMPFGAYTYDHDALPIHAQSIFDVASVTKSIPTACLALKLIDEGRLALNDPVMRYIPEFTGKGKDQVMIWHLLTHTVTFSLQLSRLKHKTPDEILREIFSAEMLEKPGIAYSYSNASSVLLGLVVERVTGKPLPVFADEIFFRPLSMTRTTFFPERFSQEEIVPTEIDTWRGIVQGMVHDESAFTLRKKLIVGSAGLFSCVPDLLIFLSMLLNNGIHGERRYMSSEIIAAMHMSQTPQFQRGTGLGWELCQPRFMGTECSEQTFGKTGFTGSLVLCDPVKGVGMVFLSNYTYPTRKQNGEVMNNIRRQVADIIFSEA